MNKNSNTYIIIYSIVMVVIVALVLSFASLSLQEKQDGNVTVEKKSDILRSIGLVSGDNSAQAVDAQYAKYIADSYAVNVNGDKIAGADAFALLKNLKAEYDKPEAERLLPVFVGNMDGNVRYILPVWGKGLWGPVWGYIALEGDWNTISDVVFDHKSETPGLGAEITAKGFTGQFVGKKIFRGEEMVSISVLKGAGSSAGNENAVDAISGGTITSRGVQEMISDCLGDYLAYIERERAAQMPLREETVVAGDSVAYDPDGNVTEETGDDAQEGEQIPAEEIIEMGNVNTQENE